MLLVVLLYHRQLTLLLLCRHGKRRHTRPPKQLHLLELAIRCLPLLPSIRNVRVLARIPCCRVAPIRRLILLNCPPLEFKNILFFVLFVTLRILGQELACAGFPDVEGRLLIIITVFRVLLVIVFGGEIILLSLLSVFAVFNRSELRVLLVMVVCCGL